MSDIEKRIKELSFKIHSLQFRQRDMDNAIGILQNELEELKLSASTDPPIPGEEEISNVSASIIEQPKVASELPKNIKSQNILRQPQKPSHSSQKLEDFIGTNLISKVGIVITIIGIFIGAKYAIDKNLISPAFRIVLGYLAGAGLIISAYLLKRKYENFSAVLMGGGLAVLYFITYISYNFYQLLPQTVSFLVMVAITAGTVLIALWYNQIIIAILGQVAAYAIPFLLSNGSGNVLVLFSYISIINIGLLFLSFKKDWKILYRIAFVLTWLIYGSWLSQLQPESKHASAGLVFLYINFFTFYFTFLSYKVAKRELYDLREIAILLLNSLIFFFAGMHLIRVTFNNFHLLTYFTLTNAFIHFSIGYIIHRLKLADKSVHQFITGLGLVFITITIPVELKGSWITLLWAFEATILFWVALNNNRRLYFQLTLPLIVIAALSLIEDWAIAFTPLNDNYIRERSLNLPFWNQLFWFSLIVSACFGYISLLAYRAKMDGYIKSFFKTIMPILFVVSLYITIFNEIGFAWDQIKLNTAAETIDNGIYLKGISQLVFSILYVALFVQLNIQYIKSKPASDLLLVAGIICLLAFLLPGLTDLGELRGNYLTMQDKGLSPSTWLLGVRYICFFSLAILCWSCRKTIQKISNELLAVKLFSLLFNLALLSIICNEYIHWMQLSGYEGQYELGLSIICGLYALVLIFYGIKSATKHLRIAAIVLFGFTLLKLFFYDLASLSTVSKTIVLVILGILLLIISFLYNKYKAVILGDDDNANSR